MTSGEAMLTALRDRLRAAIPDAEVKRNIEVPLRIIGRLIVIRDGEAEAEDQLGTDGPWYIAHTPQIEFYVGVGDAEARDAAFDSLAGDIDAALSADLTLGGLVYGMSYDRPTTDIEGIEGAAGVKMAVLEPTVEYQSDTRL